MKAEQKIWDLALQTANRMFRQVCESIPGWMTAEKARTWFAEDGWALDRSDIAAQFAETFRKGGRPDGTAEDMGWMVVYAIDALAARSLHKTTLQLAPCDCESVTWFVPVTEDEADTGGEAA